MKRILTIRNGVEVENKCPHCDGDGHFLEDNTHSGGGTMNPYLCDYCEGKGTITEDMIADVLFSNEGEPIILYKNHKDDDSSIKHF